MRPARLEPGSGTGGGDTRPDDPGDLSQDADIPDYWREEIAWLVERRYLLGDEHGKLDLSYDMARCFVVMARALRDMGKTS